MDWLFNLAPSKVCGTAKILADKFIIIMTGCGQSRFKRRLPKSIGYLPENGPLYEEMTPIGLLNFFADTGSVNITRKTETSM